MKTLKSGRHGLTLLTGVLAAVLTTACGGGSGAKPGDGAAPDGGGDVAACMTGGTGQLMLTVVGLPAGVTPMVRISGGGLDDRTMALTAGIPVTLDARGGYSIEWRRVKTAPAAGDIVGKAFYASGNTFTGCIADGANAVTLTYTQEPGSEKLWVTVVNPPTLGDVFAGFAGADIAASGMKNPTVWKSKNFTGRAATGAVDSSGNLWVPGGDRINGYAMETLAMTSDAAPRVTLTQSSGATAKFAAFDSDGNLWVSRGAPATDNSVVRYTPANMAANGSPTPAVVLKSTDMDNPAGLAFDESGDLWVASEGNAKLLKFAAARLAASYTGAPDVVITAKTAASGVPVVNAPYNNPIPLAFDQMGNLWVGYIGELVKLTPAQQAASADISGPFAINLSAGTGAFGFDESGGLWLAGPGGNFQRIPAAALATAGDVTPDIVIESSEIGGAESLVLNPAPTWSPIRDW